MRKSIRAAERLLKFDGSAGGRQQLELVFEDDFYCLLLVGKWGHVEWVPYA